VTSPAIATTEVVAAPAPQVTESNATYATDESAATTRPVRMVPLAPATKTALEREKLRGQVLVSGLVFPTEKAARHVVTAIDGQPPIAMRVVKDRGAVVQVATAAASDCVDRFSQSYELSVFVPRTSLVPRTTAEITRTFDDGTGFAIDRGAPVKITSAGLAWFDATLDQTEASPPDRLAYSLAKPYAAASFPPAPGERLVCDSAPMTKAEWLAHKQSERERSSAIARRVADARAAKRASTKTDAIDGLVDLALHDGTSTSSALADETRRDLPYCSVATASAKPAAKLGGVALAWNDPRGNDRVYRADHGYLADVGAACGRVRIAVDPAAVRGPVVAETGTTRVVRQLVWIPKPGPVFWPDGTKAGKYTGKNERFLRATERDALICVDVRGVAEEVCHRKADVLVEN
jgi:hypothetical protein